MQDRFLDDVKSHNCTVLRDDGINRHLQLRKKGKIFDEFDLITWPWHLCISGDCGTYVFCHNYDMFDFFGPWSISKKHPINTKYWSEKLLAQDKDAGVEMFSQKKFNEAVWQDFIEFAKNGEHTPEQIREIRREIQTDIIDLDNEHQSCERVYNYSKYGFQFDDFFDHDLTEYTFGFLWCLFGVTWGIRQYENLTTDALRDMNCR